MSIFSPDSLKEIPSETLFKWQRYCLFLTVALFPFPSILFYEKVLLSLGSFYGQIAAVPLLIGIIIGLFTALRDKKTKLLHLFFLFSIAYLLIISAVSIHSLFNFALHGSFNSSTFGASPRISIFRSFLVFLGISNETILYVALVFIRDIFTGVKEVIYTFGFLFWIAFLCQNDELSRVFTTIKKAVLLDVVILAPYISIEVLHLYGAEWATNLLRKINSFLYEPGGRVGWYPPIVSPNQVRGTWKEPAYFSIWLAFVTPILIHHFFQNFTSIKEKCAFIVFFTVYWIIWQMTYARTSIVMMLVIFSFYLFFLLLSHRKKDWQRISVLLITLCLSYAFVSTCGPAETRNVSLSPNAVAQSSLTPSKESQFFENTVKSTFDSNSRSNPIRIENFIRGIEIFCSEPIFGVGDTLCSVAQVKWGEERYSTLTRENKIKLKFMQKHGIFESLAGTSNLSIDGVLMCRGLLGFLATFFPIFLLGLVFFLKIYRERRQPQEFQISVFISCATVFTSAFSQGLWFLYFWCIAGVALGIVLKSKSNDLG